MNYTDINAKTVDSWVQNGWKWGRPISHETFEKAKNGEWGVYLTPTKIVPHEWFGEMRGKKILGLASGGGQQIPVFTALGRRLHRAGLFHGAAKARRRGRQAGGLYSKVRPRRYDKAPAVCRRELRPYL